MVNPKGHAAHEEVPPGAHSPSPQGTQSLPTLAAVPFTQPAAQHFGHGRARSKTSQFECQHMQPASFNNESKHGLPRTCPCDPTDVQESAGTHQHLSVLALL